MKTLSKFTLGRSNLDVVLGSQRSVLNKEGIGYSANSNVDSQVEISSTSVNHPPLFAPIVLNLAIFLIPLTLKTVGFLKVNSNGCPKALQHSLTQEDPSLFGYLLHQNNLFCRNMLKLRSQCGIWTVVVLDT